MTSEKRLVDELLSAMALMEHTPAPSGMNSAVKESLDNVKAMLAREDRGWQLFRGSASDADTGLSLDDLKIWSSKLREYASASPLGKRGFSLRHGFIHKGGIRFQNVPGINGEPEGEQRGRGAKVHKKIKSAANQHAFFGRNARRRCELALYTEGIAVWIGNDSTKELQVLPLNQISDTLTHPDFPGEIIAYQRTWTHRFNNGKGEERVRWYFVDRYKDEYLVENITVDKKRQQVEKGYTAFDMHANSFDGWALGIPDALAGWVWAGIVRDLYMDGVDVSSAMATLAFKVNTATQKGGQNAALQMGAPQGAGGTAIMGVGSDLSVLSSAGRGYDFSHIRGVIAMVATSLDVSAIHLTSNTADAGSSYGAAQSLDEPGKLTMTTRRDEHIELNERILHWMGADDAEAYYQPFDDGTEVYRRLQAVTLPWLQGTIAVDVYKTLVADILGVPDLGETPDGVLLPNNVDSLARKDVDTDGAPTGSTGSPTQGRANNVGVVFRANGDNRDDTIS